MKISIKELRRIIKEEIENIAELNGPGEEAVELEEDPTADPTAAPAAAPEEKLQTDVERIKLLIPRVDNHLKMTDLLSVTLKHALTSEVGPRALKQVLGSSIASAIAKKFGAGAQ